MNSNLQSSPQRLSAFFRDGPGVVFVSGAMVMSNVRQVALTAFVLGLLVGFVVWGG